MLKKNVLPRRMPRRMLPYATVLDTYTTYAERTPSVCQRMPPYLKRIQPMPNVPLAYVSVYRRMSDNFHTLSYASTIRNSVTGPLCVREHDVN
jgi:hypothetical protein